MGGGSTPSSFQSFAFEAIPLPAKCPMEIMDCFDQAQGHSKLQKVTVGAHIIENMIVFTVSSELLFILQPNFVGTSS